MDRKTEGERGRVCVWARRFLHLMIYVCTIQFSRLGHTSNDLPLHAWPRPIRTWSRGRGLLCSPSTVLSINTDFDSIVYLCFTLSPRLMLQIDGEVAGLTLVVPSSDPRARAQ